MLKSAKKVAFSKKSRNRPSGILLFDTCSLHELLHPITTKDGTKTSIAEANLQFEKDGVFQFRISEMVALELGLVVRDGQTLVHHLNPEQPAFTKPKRSAPALGDESKSAWAYVAQELVLPGSTMDQKKIDLRLQADLRGIANFLARAYAINDKTIVPPQADDHSLAAKLANAAWWAHRFIQNPAKHDLSMPPYAAKRLMNDQGFIRGILGFVCGEMLAHKNMGEKATEKLVPLLLQKDLPIFYVSDDVGAQIRFLEQGLHVTPLSAQNYITCLAQAGILRTMGIADSTIQKLPVMNKAQPTNPRSIARRNLAFHPDHAAVFSARLG